MKKKLIALVLATVTTFGVISVTQPIKAQASGFGWVEGHTYLDKSVWFYFDQNGHKATNWRKLGGHWYHFREDGEMAQSWFQDSDERWYYMGEDGAMRTGWVWNSGSWYYFGDSGALLKGWQLLGGKWYYLDKKTGVMQIGWAEDSNKWYYLNDGGDMKVGWVKSGQYWCFMNNEGYRVIGDCYINGQLNRFDNNGIWLGLDCNPIQQVTYSNKEIYQRIANLIWQFKSDRDLRTILNTDLMTFHQVLYYNSLAIDKCKENIDSFKSDELPSDIVNNFNKFSDDINSIYVKVKNPSNTSSSGTYEAMKFFEDVVGRSQSIEDNDITSVLKICKQHGVEHNID